MDVTILDVIEGFFGEHPKPGDATKLSREQIVDFGERAVESANAQPMEFNSMGAEIASDSDAYNPVYPGGFLSSWWSSKTMTRELRSTLLYHPQIIVNDRIADFFGLQRINDLPELRPRKIRLPDGHKATGERGPRLWAGSTTYAGRKDDLNFIREWLDGELQDLAIMAPLLRSGAVITRSQWPIILENNQSMLSSSRHDVSSANMVGVAQRLTDQDSVGITAWDNIRGARVRGSWERGPEDKWSWQPEFYYLAKCLAYAYATGSTYIPGNTPDLLLLRNKIKEVAAKLPVQITDTMSGDGATTLLSEVGKLVLPDVDVDMKTLVKIREDNDSFEDWRRFLRGLERDSRGLTHNEIKEMIAGETSSLILQTKNYKANSGLKDKFVGGAVEVGINVGPALGLAATTGGPLGAALLPPLLTGVMSWVWAGVRPRNFPPDRYRVVATLTARK